MFRISIELPLSLLQAGTQEPIVRTHDVWFSLLLHAVTHLSDQTHTPRMTNADNATILIEDYVSYMPGDVSCMWYYTW